ncbi:MAG: hypothetical protein SF162_04245 [bacterium]|nr:hypothetical protein [bacterium]
MNTPFSPGIQAALAALSHFRADGIPLTAYAGRWIIILRGHYPVLEGALYRLGHAAAWRDTAAALRHIYGDTAVMERPDTALAAALFWLLQFPDHPLSARQHALQADPHAAFTALLIDMLTVEG